MFDVTSGSCSECFRTIDFGKQKRNEAIDGVPHLSDIPLSLAPRRKAIFAAGIGSLRLGEADSLRSVNAMVGSIGASDQSFLLTGGSDCRIRFWDFSVPSKCYTCGNETVQPRPSYERIDFGQTSRLMLCRQAPIPPAHDVDSSKVPRKLFQGTRLIPHGHQDAIQDLKVMRNGLVSCSRDCTVKIWK
jgi:WD40 repeat protein